MELPLPNVSSSIAATAYMQAASLGPGNVLGTSGGLQITAGAH